jgi:hypothetical protein
MKGPSNGRRAADELKIFYRMTLLGVSGSLSNMMNDQNDVGEPSSGETRVTVVSCFSCFALKKKFRYGDSNPGILRERQVC